MTFMREFERWQGDPPSAMFRDSAHPVAEPVAPESGAGPETATPQPSPQPGADVAVAPALRIPIRTENELLVSIAQLLEENVAELKHMRAALGASSVLLLVEAGQHTGIGEPYLRPLTWTRTAPMQPGFRHARMPGADRFTVVLVTRDSEGVLVYGVTAVKYMLVYGVTAVKYRPVEGSDLEWGSAVIQEPK